MMANSLIDILNSIFDYSGLPAEENAATTPVSTSSKPAKTSAGTGKAGGISGKIPKTQGQASPQVVEPAQQALYIEPKGDVFDIEKQGKTAFEVPKEKKDETKKTELSDFWGDDEGFPGIDTFLRPEKAYADTGDEDAKDNTNTDTGIRNPSLQETVVDFWKGLIYPAMGKEYNKKWENNSNIHVGNDYAKNRLNSMYRQLASEYGTTLSPEDLETLREGYVPAINMDGSYSNASLRKSLDSPDAYYAEMDKRNREAAINSIANLAKARAYNPTGITPEYDKEANELADLEAQLLEANAAYGKAASEEDIASGQQSIADLQKQIDDKRAAIETREPKSSYADKVREYDEITARLLGNAPGVSTTSADIEGKAGEQPSSTSSSARNNQSREFYDWLNTDSGKAFLDYWGKQGYDFSEANKGWSRMRTMNNADLWGDMYGLGDLSKYGLENFVTPEGWDVRLANSGIDATAEDAIDQLMKYMFVTNALRRSDLLQENPEWDRYGSLTGQDELIAYLIESGLMPYSDQLLGSWNSAGLDANDIAELYMASRLSQAGAGDSSTDELIDIVNNSLANAGDVYRLGYLEEGGPFWAESRPNDQTYSPRMLYDESMPVSAYAYNEAGDTYDLIDWNILDTYYKLLSDAAEKEGKQIGFSTGKEVS